MKWYICTCDEVSTLAVERVPVEAVAPAVEVLMNSVSAPAPALTVELTKEPVTEML